VVIFWPTLYRQDQPIVDSSIIIIHNDNNNASIHVYNANNLSSYMLPRVTSNEKLLGDSCLLLIIFIYQNGTEPVLGSNLLQVTKLPVTSYFLQ